MIHPQRSCRIPFKDVNFSEKYYIPLIDARFLCKLGIIETFELSVEILN